MFVEPPVVDSHCHILTRRMPLRPDAWTRPDYDYTAEDYLADLDRHGVAFGVIAAASLYGDYNDYTLQALSAHKRLRATLYPQPDLGLHELRRLRDLGVVGVRLQWKKDAVLPDFDGFEYGKYLNRLADCGMHVELNASSEQLAHALPKLREKGLAIVVDHFGLLRSPEGVNGEGFKATLAAAEAGKTWVKISAGFRLEHDVLHDCTQKLLSVAGPERLLWGSDSPFVGHEDVMSYEKALGMFYEIVPDAETRRTISDAALRFYFF
ncbi:amidohydrolase family protein [Hyphococcus luteus]|uniref:Amidohydrolase n=1 Tax=Hyphococcus luteus TaxID=2058213 RepID=A0A2S7K1Q9_9PROT|nr:amidohydrolase family protein [Marinicaulis flavus]PQA86401.1 amidohydrolase [Marinicaulis flavus]